MTTMTQEDATELKQETDNEQSFVCATCGETTPVENGAADDMPESCDKCWYAAHCNETDGGDVT